MADATQAQSGASACDALWPVNACSVSACMVKTVGFEQNSLVKKVSLGHFFLTMVFLYRTSSFYCSKMNAPVHFENQCVTRSAWLSGLKVLRQTHKDILHASVLALYPYTLHYNTV